MNHFSDNFEVIKRCFKIDKISKSVSSLTRFWNKFNKRSLNEKLLNVGIKFSIKLAKAMKIESDTLRFDSTVITRYGEQEGALRGYNPSKRGRPSHQPQLAFLGSGLTVNIWNRSGNITSNNGIIGFFKQTISYISDISITRILCDSGYYRSYFINYLEDQGFEYVISAPIIQLLQRTIYSLSNWIRVAEGIEVNEFQFQHQATNWGKERRYVVVRQEMSKRKKATGKVFPIFEEYFNQHRYRHSLLITNNIENTPYEIWNFYKPRANDENIIENLKTGFGFDAFNTDNFWATEAILITICLIYHNLICYLMKKVVNPECYRQKLRTFRMQFLIIPAVLCKNGRKFVIRLGIRNQKKRLKFLKILEEIELINFNCNAVQL